MHNLILAWASWILAIIVPAQQVSFSYYSEQFEVTYRSELLANGPLRVSVEGIDNFYSSVTQKDWIDLHLQLQTFKNLHGLNDWLYVKLVNKTIKSIAGFTHENEQRMLEMHLLTLAGYDVRLCYNEHNLFVYGYTEDALFEVPMITIEDRKYVNLSSALQPQRETAKHLTMHPLRPLPEGSAMEINLKLLPNLKADIQERTYRFRYKGELQTLKGLGDRTIVNVMRDYPFFDEGNYLTVPLSDETGSRLKAQLEPMLKAKSEKEKLQYLAAFTRSAFVYKEDKESFGFSKPMIADEVLYYPVSDCEDRSALFFSLVKDILKLPVIAIAYHDHLSVAVSSSSLTGKPITYNGVNFFVCDPTGPKESIEIGNPPYGYEDQPFELVASFLPKG